MFKSKKYKTAIESLDRTFHDMYNTCNSTISNANVVLHDLMETNDFSKARKNISYSRNSLENAKKRVDDEFHLFEKYYDVGSVTAVTYSKRMLDYEKADALLKTHEYYLEHVIEKGK